MSDSSVNPSGVSLGVGTIIGDSFSIFFGNIFAVMILGFVPTFIGVGLSDQFAGASVNQGGPELQVNWFGFALLILVQMVTYGVTIALMVQLAYDAKLNRPLRLKSYVSPAFKASVPIAILSVVGGILTWLGSLFLIIPGLWLYAVFSVMSPAVVIERIGYSGLSRSASLTKGYRWPILGSIILMGICLMLVFFVIAFIVGIAAYFISDIAGSTMISLILNSALTALAYGLGGIFIALIYARLREIKEGVSVDQIVSIFD